MNENKSKTILIIEDNSDMGYALVVMLQSADYMTIAATDGESGLDMALQQHPDAILLDLKLPKLDGKDVLRKIREDEWGKRVPVIVLTNEDDTKTIADTVEHSAQGYFIKAETRLDTVVDSLNEIFQYS
jgi:two-component system response regulator VicR